MLNRFIYFQFAGPVLEAAWERIERVRQPAGGNEEFRADAAQINGPESLIRFPKKRAATGRAASGLGSEEREAPSFRRLRSDLAWTNFGAGSPSC